jgi:hypothetical protein
MNEVLVYTTDVFDACVAEDVHVQMVRNAVLQRMSTWRLQRCHVRAFEMPQV